MLGQVILVPPYPRSPGVGLWGMMGIFNPETFKPFLRKSSFNHP